MSTRKLRKAIREHRSKNPEAEPGEIMQAIESKTLEKGQKVRFTVPSLGASERDDLGHVVSDTYGPSDMGVLAFLHPNQKPSPQGCKGWWFVEVDSKTGPARKLYVGVGPSMIKLEG